MTPGPSFTVPSTSTSALREPNFPEPSVSAAVAGSELQQQVGVDSEQTISDSVRNGNAPSNSNDAMRRHDPSLAQPKHCAHCGQLLEALASSLDRQPGPSRTPSSASLSAPSPSSYAFAPDYNRSQHRLQPHQSLTSAINAAAAVALSRHLGTDELMPTDADGHAICTQCAAQLADSAASSSSIVPSTTTTLAYAPLQSTQSEAQTAARAGHSDPDGISSPVTASQSNAPEAQLTILVDNMGAGGDAALAQSAEDVLMQDPSSFPPLDRAPITPALRRPPSPSAAGRSTSRGRIRFADASTSTSDDQAHSHHVNDHARDASLLGRSGSFSRSLSYNGSESVSSSSAPVVVSFPPSIGATPASETAPILSSQDTHSVASFASSPARPSNQQSRSRSSGNVTQDISSHDSATATPGAVKQRRPSSARRLSRSGSSTGPTTLSFAAAGSAVPTPAASSAADASKDDDPYGPAAMTRPRLSQIPRQVIADELYHSARQTRPAHLISSSTSTSLAASSAQQSVGIDPTRAVRYHVDLLSYSSSDPPLEQNPGSKRRDQAVGMDVDEDDAISHGLAAKLNNIRWFDTYKPDPLSELSRLRNPPRGRGCLYPGATFNGTQKSGRNSYDVTVRIVNVDLEASHLCGYLNIRGLTEDWPELTTYFDAEIIGDRYGFVTGKWGATEADDLKHWARFPPFRPLRSALSKPGLRFNHLNKPFVFMRWKEKFLVPDHRVRDINGASFAGFYYVCVELGESAAANGRGRSGEWGAGSSTLTGPGVSGAQWYAARTQRRRELSLSAPTQPHSPPAAAPVGGFWPASPTLPLSSAGGEDPFANMWPADSQGEDFDDLGAAGKMSGFYFHENSEPYQQLSLRHTPESSSCSFEMR